MVEMNFKRVSSMLAALVLISGLANTEGDDKGKLVEECKFRGNMCDVTGSCIERLRENWLVGNCDALKDAPEKSLYIEESLSFAPVPYTIDHSLAKNWTYSVFMSDDMRGKNLELVDGCCNMKGNDKCLMPATLDKDKTFLVVFPHKDSKRKKYCWSIVHYGDAPMDACKDDDLEFIHPCISIEDGIIIIKTRYQPLGRTIIKPMDRCYSTVSSQEMPANYESRKPEKLFQLDNATVLHGNESKNIPPSIGIRATNYTCKVRERITEEHNLGEMSNIYSEGDGDFVCFIMKDPGKEKYFDVVFCSNMASPLPIIIMPIAISVSAVVILLIFIGSLKACRICSKLNKKIKIPGIFGNPIEDSNEDRSDTTMRWESNKPDEVYLKIGKDCDDTISITEQKVASEVEGDGDKSSKTDNIQVPDQSPAKKQLPELPADNPPLQKDVSSHSGDFNIDDGSTVDINQPSPKSHQRLNAELNSEYEEDRNGYVEKPQTNIQKNSHKYENREASTENIGDIDSGCTPQYIAKI